MMTYQQMFFMFVNKFKAGEVKMKMTMDGTIYDKDFDYNQNKDILTASSSTNTSCSFGSDGKTLTDYISSGQITLKVEFLSL